MSETVSSTSRKRGRPTAEEREERRDQILDAAVALFVSNGYGQVTVDEIAAVARVTKRTIYTYFGDKAEVFTAAIERFRARDLANHGATAESLLETAARLVFVLHSDNAVGLHRLMIGEAAQFPELASGFYSSGPRGYVALLAQCLPPASGLVQVKTDAEALALAEALFGLLLGEPHRRRLLGLAPAPSAAAARAHAEQVIALLGLTERPRDDG
ncbi:TetR/AcrR family transcriptional regulator [Pseudoclavibacter sp. RFBJ3]|uniref:TetR/AcrR family transcriptional regulator n=1 Tax=unclassified Pseudoclavibacter TaxID=2615177 RepID=UPI000CE7E2A0|nr:MULTISPECIES: TetR/AcrR family transcriptional regulator [unclassified Pseudoclavibacter]PPF87205.1 TetR/AcrR family transcriptional regulator [Pseudoclavibacter sp. RFBJ5]PPF89428.1 TetR/AcrR family transcriptional regulator [Pseudoclavibacter sp. RFBJ3]PPG00767.1 TetR/AcrR family transcriptional regulator [Pseudoclavibacter sp. RFBH5]PPG18875.1 TetR/AcrR family transcriptional regulator [Pseudoclavibacter sp. RFBI4]